MRALNSPPWDNSNMALLERQTPPEETLERSDESGHRGAGSRRPAPHPNGLP